MSELHQKLYDEFECLGYLGKCLLTCCTTCWSVSLTDSEVEKYRNSQDDDFGKKVFQCIDTEKKCMKAFPGNDPEKCGLLEPSGACSLVLKKGEGALSQTCHEYPRGMNVFGSFTERYVEISCPLVAERLLNRDVSLMKLYKNNEGQLTSPDDLTVSILSFARDFMLNELEKEPGNAVSRKLFLILKILTEIKNLISQNELTPEKVAGLIGSFSRPDSLNTINETINRISQNYDGIANFCIGFISTLVKKAGADGQRQWKEAIYNKHIAKQLDEWQDDPSLLSKDLSRFIPFFREKYPAFFENYLAYQLSKVMLINAISDFSAKFISAMIEENAIMLSLAAIFSSCGSLSDDETIITICSIDRAAVHSGNEENIAYSTGNNGLDTPLKLFPLLLY